jgi:hypothetical protein
MHIAYVSRYCLVLYRRHTIWRVDRTMRAADCENHMICNCTNCMWHVTVDHVYLAGSCWVDLAAVTHGSLPANHNQQMVSWMDMGHEAVASGKADYIGAKQPVARKRFSRRVAVG